jgi:large subunit ribosomal protein L25
MLLKAEVRGGRGKEAAKKMRREGKIPAVLYSSGKEAVALTVELADVATIIRSESGVNSVFSLAIEGGETADVKFQERQIDPVKGRLIHADFVRV